MLFLPALKKEYGPSDRNKHVQLDKGFGLAEESLLSSLTLPRLAPRAGSTGSWPYTMRFHWRSLLNSAKKFALVRLRPMEPLI